MNNIEIQHKNDKIIKRLIQLKSEEYRLSIIDKVKLKYLDKFNIPDTEINIIDKILIKEGLATDIKQTPSDDGTNSKKFIFTSTITKPGLKALKGDYLNLNIISNKIIKIHTVATIILTISTIISIWYGFSKSEEINKLKIQIDQKVRIIDTLKIELNNMKNNIDKKDIRK